MAINILCDGCGREINTRNMHAEVSIWKPVDYGEQTRYDWCRPCLNIAKAALANQPERKSST